MNIMICLDERNGLLFNNRRQSRDGAICRRVLDIASGKALWMNEYSSKLFEEADIKISSNFLSEAKDGDFCFVEDLAFLQNTSKIEKVIVYRWDKVYPADVRMDEKLLQNLTCTTDFCGDSHDKITEEIYVI